MTDDEARKLATRFVDTWPNGPKAYIWRDALIDLDANYAAAAYRRCSTRYERITVSGFTNEYEYLARPLLQADPKPHEVERYEPARSTAPTISLDEYLERVAARSARGNLEATAELDRWDRWLRPTANGAPHRYTRPTEAEL